MEKTSVDDVVERGMSRRILLQGLAATAMSMALPIKALSNLTCQDHTIPTAYGALPVRTCIASVAYSSTSVQQHQSYWCWAACMEMVFAYHGHDVPQEKIVTAVYGSLVNLPGQPYTILMGLNREWQDSKGVKFHSYATSLGINPVTIAREMQYNRPVIIGTHHHAMVVTIMNYTGNQYGQLLNLDVWVADPAYGRQRQLSAQEWMGINFAAIINVV